MSGARRRERIAVVGAGVSGLVAAAELHRAGHDVHVFEAGSYAGGHTNTVEVETPRRAAGPSTPASSSSTSATTPTSSGCSTSSVSPSQPADMSFSVSDGRGEFEWATRGPRGLFARPGHALDPRFHRMLRDLVRFNREARELVGSRGDGPVAAPLPRRRRLLGVLRRAAARAAGLGGLVRGPRVRCGAFPPASSPSSSTTTACCSCAGGPRGARSPVARTATSRR